MNKYFEKNEAEKYVFYKIPKALFTDQKYCSVSTDAKCCTHCCLTECIYPQETAGLIGTAECINSSQ